MKRSHSSLEFEFWLETTNTRQSYPIRADGCFIDQSLVNRLNLSTLPLDEPIPVRNANSSLSQGGPVEAYTDVILFAPPSFRDRLHLEVATLVYDVILGLPWLKRHKPKVNWKEGTLELLRDTTLSALTAVDEPLPLDDSLDPLEDLIASIGLNSIPKAFDFLRDPPLQRINTVTRDHSRSTTVEEDMQAFIPHTPCHISPTLHSPVISVQLPCIGSLPPDNCSVSQIEPNRANHVYNNDRVRFVLYIRLF